MSCGRLITELRQKCRAQIQGTNFDCAGRQAEDLVTEALSNITHVKYGASEPFSIADRIMHIDHYVLFTEATYGAYRSILALLQCKLGVTEAKLPVIPRQMLHEFKQECVFVKPLIVYIIGRPNSDSAVIDARELFDGVMGSIVTKKDCITIQIKYR